MGQREFWPFEPVELEVRIEVARGTRRRFYIPHQLDPGYESFRIWIEDPLGERRLFRSPRHYCPGRRRLCIMPGKPFERDISIFGESGGYTFRRAGRHLIWVTSAVPPRGVLRSNTIEVNVRPVRPADRLCQEARQSLSPPEEARLLYYRVGAPGSRAVQRLTSFCEHHPDLPSAAAARYAVGRTLLKAAARQTRAESVHDWARQGVEQLARALDLRHLSRHRRTIAQRLVERGVQ
jgi:hypothetical protein